MHWPQFCVPTFQSVLVPCHWDLPHSLGAAVGRRIPLGTSVQGLGVCQYCCSAVRASSAWIFLASFSDSGAGSWVPGLHGSLGLWAQTRPDHYAEARGYSGSTEEANEGMLWKTYGLCQGRKIILAVVGGNTFPVKVPWAEMLWNGSAKAPKRKHLGISMHRKLVGKILWLLPALASESL